MISLLNIPVLTRYLAWEQDSSTLHLVLLLSCCKVTLFKLFAPDSLFAGISNTNDSGFSHSGIRIKCTVLNLRGKNVCNRLTNYTSKLFVAYMLTPSAQIFQISSKNLTETHQDRQLHFAALPLSTAKPTNAKKLAKGE